MINLTPFDKCKQNITMHKDGKYIILQKDNEINKKYYRYNLSTNTFERVNINEYQTNISPQKVEYITGWIKDCNFQTKDNKFARMFFFTKASPHLRRFKSVIRFIEHLGDEDTIMFEYIDSLNLNLPFINNVIDKQQKFMRHEYNDDDIKIVYKRFKKDKTNIKAIKKITKELNRGITIDEFIYFTNLQNGNKLDLFIELKHYSEIPTYQNCFVANIFRYGRNHKKHIFQDTEEFRTFANTVTYIDKIMELIEEFNLNVEIFIKWLNKMYFIEKVTLNDIFATNHYQDYLKMQKDIYKGKMPKINKYQTNFMK